MTLVQRRLLALAVALAAGTIIFLSLGLFQEAVVRAQEAVRPEPATWAIRLAAVAGVLIAQVVLAAVVVPLAFRRGRGDAMYGLASLLGAIGCGVGALVLAARAW